MSCIWKYCRTNEIPDVDLDLTMDSKAKAFFELVCAGLWEELKFEVEGLKFKDFHSADWNALLQLAREQSVVGLVAAGLDHITDGQVPHGWAFQVVRKALSLEQHNRAKNVFLNELMDDLGGAGVHALLMKGQGLAQCYSRPLWRASGDIDLLLNEDDYEKAKALLLPLASKVEAEYVDVKHLCMTVKGWLVELHGTVRSEIGKRVDSVIDEIQNDCFGKDGSRIWENGTKVIYLPNPDNDVMLVFTHVLQHFFNGGIGLRQICDWCRLLYTYKGSLNHGLLESRLKKAGLMTEWKAFGVLAIEYLGMPVEAMPLLDVTGEKSDGRCEIDKRLKRKADRILNIVMETGNLGNNRDSSYHQRHSFLVYKAISFWNTSKDCVKLGCIFPLDSFRIWWKRLFDGMDRASKGIT